MISVRSTFSDWHEIDADAAVSYARWRLRAITTGKDDQERVDMINAKFRGVTFTLDELRQEAT
jgi:hypothetical protein